MTEPEEPQGIADARLYAKSMGEIRQRLILIRWLVATNLVARSEFYFTTELIFVQFRKVLELIAFGTLTANRGQYAEVHKLFGKHWRAKGLLVDIAKINPEFYPVPFEDSVTETEGIKLFTPRAEGFLTQEEFVTLYDASSDMLHTRNPFSDRDPTRQIGYHVNEWVERIQRLVAFHSMVLLDGNRWVVVIPAEGDVHVYPAEKRET